MRTQERTLLIAAISFRILNRYQSKRAFDRHYKLIAALDLLDQGIISLDID